MVIDAKDATARDIKEQRVVNRGWTLGIAAKTIFENAHSVAKGVNRPGQSRMFKGTFEGHPVKVFIGHVFQQGENAAGLPEGEVLGKYEWANVAVYFEDQEYPRIATHDITIRHEPNSPQWEAGSGSSIGCRGGYAELPTSEIARYEQHNDSWKYVADGLLTVAEITKAILRGEITPVPEKQT